MIYLFELPQLQASLDCSVHDGMYRLPVQPKQSCCSRHAGACLHYFNCHAFEQKRKARMLVGPGSRYCQDSASFALRARKRGVYRCRELHCVQVSPRALWSQVCLRTIAFALRTFRHCTTISCRIGIEMGVLNMGCFRDGGRIVDRIDKTKV